MSLKKIKNNVKIDGVEYDIWYNPETGSVQARTDVGVFNKQGDLVFDSLNDQNSVFEDAIKKDSWLKKLCRRFSFRSKCCCGSECELEPDESPKDSS